MVLFKKIKNPLFKGRIELKHSFENRVNIGNSGLGNHFK